MRCLVNFQGLNCTRWHGLWCSITFARIDYPQDQLSSTEPMTQKNWLCTKIRKTDDISVKGNRCDHQKNPSPKKSHAVSHSARPNIFSNRHSSQSKWLFIGQAIGVYGWRSPIRVNFTKFDWFFLALFFLVFCAIGECLLSIWTGNFVLSIETMCMVFNGVWPKIPFTTHKFIQISNIFSMAKTILNILSDETVKKKTQSKNHNNSSNGTASTYLIEAKKKS